MSKEVAPGELLVLVLEGTIELAMATRDESTFN
jgi:hypothetical protein